MPLPFKSQISYQTSTFDLARFVEEVFNIAPGTVNLEQREDWASGELHSIDIVSVVGQDEQDAQIISDFVANPGAAPTGIVGTLMRDLVNVRSRLPQGLWLLYVD